MNSTACSRTLQFLQLTDLTSLQAVASSGPEAYRSCLTERLHTMLGDCLLHGHSMTDKEARLFSLAKKMSKARPLSAAKSPTPSCCEDSGEDSEDTGWSSEDFGD